MTTALIKARELARYHFTVATVFEAARYIHQALLYLSLNATSYGLTGSLFSLSYLSANLASLEGGTALIPYCHIISQHPQRFSFLTKQFLLPQVVQNTIGAVLASWAAYKLSSSAALSTSVFCIAFGEGMRIALRPLVYSMAKSKRAALVEAGAALLYILIVWLPTLLPTGVPPEPQNILLLYALVSPLAALYLLGEGLHSLKRLPIKPKGDLPKKKGIYKNQLALIWLHLPHTLFSANFLVPFFAGMQGLQAAAPIKIASEIATAFRSILRSTIGIPLNALAVAIQGQTNKQTRITQKSIRELFDGLQKTSHHARAVLLLAFVGPAVALLLPIEPILRYALAGFCLLTVTDYLCIPYELLSLHTAAMGRAAMVRSLEVCVGLAAIRYGAENPVAVIMILAGARVASFQALKAIAAPSPAL